jgi:catechol 1,2-dioxygenase
MSSAKPSQFDKPRLNELFDDLNATLKGFIRKHHVTYEEFHRGLAFLTEVGEKGETPLLFDVFLESTVDLVNNSDRGGTATAVEGPFYLKGMPEMKSPCVLPHRANEPGEVLYFSGTVRSTDGHALPEAIVDYWQADSEGNYSHFNIPKEKAPFNLRARVKADDRGRFEIGTWVPSSYEIPKGGPTGALVKALGQHAWRPAHLHALVQHPECEDLMTQIFIQGDQWIDSDVVGAVKESLIAGMVKHDDAAEIAKRGLKGPFYTLEFDFVLPRGMKKAA